MEPRQDPIEVVAREFREQHKISNRPSRDIAAWAQVDAIPEWLDRARAYCAEPEPAAAKAAGWLLDNDYHILRASRRIRQDLPRNFYRKLPSFSEGPYAGLPRAFCLAHGLLTATRLQISLTAAVQFVRAYQEDASLTIAELWAFPTMLRLACLEVLTCAFSRLVPGLKPPFDASPCTGMMGPFDETESVSRALRNLIVITSISWEDFFDRASDVETTLQQDPAEIYGKMDFETRDRCRKAIEDLAQGAARTEVDVARSAIDYARSASLARQDGHVGHWLIGSRRPEAEARLGYRPALWDKLRSRLSRHAGWLYAGALTVTGLATLAPPAIYLASKNASALEWIVALFLAVLPASILSIAVVNWLVTLAIAPRVLPKMDFKNGIPSDCATAVAMPIIVGTMSEAAAAVERLEMHRLANPDPGLRFVLLTDHIDAQSEQTPGDAAIEQVFVEGIERLNAAHGQDGAGPFHLLHRPRRFNPGQSCWMGWERKRGKLEQFNRLLLWDDESGFALQVGDTHALRGIRFVVTVDADTSLPPGTVHRLVGALAHPINTAQFDVDTGRVAHGYTVLQPRVEIRPESEARSLFATLSTGDTSIDIYSRATSDVYQDLFRSGAFVGKGIYEVAPFQSSFLGRVPENTLLSHDLFEGAHGRAALATDIVVYESFPTAFPESSRRWHRWVRGDWQILPWLFNTVPAEDGRRIKNRLGALDRWKIIDNLRRSLIPIGLVALAVCGWLFLPGNPWVWTLLAFGPTAAALLLDLAADISRGPSRGTFWRLAGHGGRWWLFIVFLATEAAVALDAIVRTLWRIYVSRKNLLEWRTAAHVAARHAMAGSRLAAWRDLWYGPIAALVFGAAIAYFNPAALLPASPFLLLWFASPAISVWTGRARQSLPAELPLEDRMFLRLLARRTWLFFETFVGPDDNWLPPDNYQEAPDGEIAHRTSPTNIGMMFLSTISAWDLGYLTSIDLRARVDDALDTLDRLPLYRGHVLNWYDTRLLHPLEPRYVSTVDSGNLAVCLIALKSFCEEAAERPGLHAAIWDGLSDTLTLLRQALEKLPHEHAADVRSNLGAIADAAAKARDAPLTWWPVLTEIATRLRPDLETTISNAIVSIKTTPPVVLLHELRIWRERLNHHLTGMQRDLETLCPWLPLLNNAPPALADLVRGLNDYLSPAVSLPSAVLACAQAHAMLPGTLRTTADPAAARWLSDLEAAIEKGAQAQQALRRDLLREAVRADAMAVAMDFGFLYDKEAHLFHIGFNVRSDRIDANHYDLFASEARLASYFAVAMQIVPVQHWFFLGRPMSRLPDGLALISWNGSMFEYMMPSLLLRGGYDTLIAQSERVAVDSQRRHAAKAGTPWGVSESAYASFNSDRHYQYHAFGVPGLGLQRGLSRDRVIAPYASVLALPARPLEAVRNLREICALGGSGHYGVFEALDYTPDRLPGKSDFVVVRAYMAHHQGMILSAIGNALQDGVLARRFLRDRRMRTMELLLEERVPWEVPPEAVREDEHQEPDVPGEAIPALPSWRPSVDAAVPSTLVLGNGQLSSWISAAGAGGLRWHNQALTRWTPDATQDGHGLWIYVDDQESGDVWSVGRQPTGKAPDDSHVVFHASSAEFHRRDRDIAIGMVVGVAAANDVEIRQLTIVNESDRPRSIRLTSYGEVVLGPPLGDERHPAFSKLFVGSEYLPRLNGLLFTRRPRSPHDAPVVLLHRIVSDNPDQGQVGYETDRESFFGRGGDVRRPRGVVKGLSASTGWTLDPILALQISLDLAPRERRQIAFLTMAAGSRQSVLELAECCAELSSLDWALGDAATETTREAWRLGLEPARLPELSTIASLLMYPHALLRAPASAIAANRLGQPRLWGLLISGDLPILLLKTNEQAEIDLVPLLIRAQKYWRRRGLRIDLVILRTGMTGYQEPVRERILGQLREGGVQEFMGRPGGIHLIFADQINDEDWRFLETAAHVVLDEGRGSIAHQLSSAIEVRPHRPRFEPTGAPPGGPPVQDAEAALVMPPDLLFANGYGGFTPDGREYIIHLEPGQHTPGPWCNILANDDFGALVTEAGGGCTWAINGGENRLTPWTNDPVLDPPSEALYLRDEETGDIWTTTPGPAGKAFTCQIRHGAGYTQWRQHSHGLEQEMTIFVAPADPVKIIRLRLRNLSPRGRRATATYYAEWLLGALPSVSRPHVVCEYDPGCQALLARNPWNPDFAERVAFLTSSHPHHGITADRGDFVGREGHMDRPAGLVAWDLGGRVRAGDDPCAALQVHLDIAAGETVEVVFVLGQGRDRAHAEELVRTWREPERAARGLDEVNRYWDGILGAVRVQTPDPAFDVMLNRWLLYQNVASRIMARVGFYQAGGALGFRDQLQDMLAVVHVDPARVRAHILACAARQFEEGDVLHWWHMPAERGVRTRCSDDFLWLPYVTARYVEATGDESILHEEIAFLHADPLGPEEEDRYTRFEASTERRSVFEHCQRAVEHGNVRGAHGLPLMGAGDWNDGMNRIGEHGRGESVWLGWFTIATIAGFNALAARVGRDDLVERWTRRSEELRQAIEATAWDGAWYLRAFDDEGRKWGAAALEECRIDSISQSWAVISRAGSPERSRLGVEAVARELIGDDDRIVRLLWPPFDRTPRDPGYIKAYPPGIRENGGQYTHAAAWLGFAFAGLKDGDGAWGIFDLINPIRAATNRAEAEHYRVEPYAIAADVYGAEPHTGRGGWTWYTGSAAWTWRLGVEAILGLHLREGALHLDPCLPKSWGGFTAEMRGPAGVLAIEVEDPDGVGHGVAAVFIDGTKIEGAVAAFPTDGSTRRVRIRLGLPMTAAGEVAGEAAGEKDLVEPVTINSAVAS